MNRNWFTGHTEKCYNCGYPVYFKRPHKIPEPLKAMSLSEATPDFIVDDIHVQTATCPNCHYETKMWLGD